MLMETSHLAAGDDENVNRGASPPSAAEVAVLSAHPACCHFVARVWLDMGYGRECRSTR